MNIAKSVVLAFGLIASAGSAASGGGWKFVHQDAGDAIAIYNESGDALAVNCMKFRDRGEVTFFFTLAPASSSPQGKSLTLFPSGFAYAGVVWSQRIGKNFLGSVVLPENLSRAAEVLATETATGGFEVNGEALDPFDFSKMEVAMTGLLSYCQIG